MILQFEFLFLTVVQLTIKTRFHENELKRKTYPSAKLSVHLPAALKLRVAPFLSGRDSKNKTVNLNENIHSLQIKRTVISCSCTFSAK